MQEKRTDPFCFSPHGSFQPRRSPSRSDQIGGKTAPAITLKAPLLADQLGSGRIQMNVIGDRREIPAPSRLHQHRLVAALEQTTALAVTPVVTSRDTALEPAHPGHQVGPRSLQQPVIMVTHEHVSMNLPTGALTSLPQRLQEPLAIRLIFENVLPPITPGTSHDRLRLQIPPGPCAPFLPASPAQSIIQEKRTDPF